MPPESKKTLYFGFFSESESTQSSVADPELGRRADEAIAQILESHHFVGTYHVLPTEAEANAPLYRDLNAHGHEIGLHVHPAEQGYEEFLGVYGPDEQRAILTEAKDRAEDALGFGVGSLCIGYGSTNDHSYPIFTELGLRHGVQSVPGRVLVECPSVHAGAPLGMHYAHRFNRVLEGDLDYVEVPHTNDPDSRMWGGKHPQDLRIELVDAKNHYYTIRKSIERQLRECPPVIYILGVTHNVFEFDQPNDFRRQTFEHVLRHLIRLADEFSLELAPATIEDLATLYRSAVPLGGRAASLKLDRRAYQTT